jgi:hypothetical protein
MKYVGLHYSIYLTKHANKLTPLSHEWTSITAYQLPKDQISSSEALKKILRLPRTTTHKPVRGGQLDIGG